MEVSIVLPYTRQTSSKKLFDNVESLMSQFESHQVKVDLIIACSSSDNELLQNANTFTGNHSYCRTAFTSSKNIKDIIFAGVKICNRQVTLVLNLSNLGKDVSYYNILKKFESHKRFDCFALFEECILVGAICRTFDLRYLAEFATGKTLDEVLRQFQLFYIMWGSCIRYNTNMSNFKQHDYMLGFKGFEKLRAKKFIKPCKKCFSSYEHKLKFRTCVKSSNLPVD